MADVHEDVRQRHAQEARARRSARAGDSAGPRALEWLRWRPTPAAGLGAAVAAALIVVAVIALASGSGKSASARVIRAEVLPHGARATLRVSAGHAQLDIADMPQSAPGHVYEIWLKRSHAGRAIPTDALFTVDAAGATTVGVPGNVKDVKEIMVTAEPVGGSRVPTLPALIVARLS
jgi:hypothetical protein